MRKIKPIGLRVLIESIEDNKTTKSGIILPGAKDERPNKGIVVSVSNEVKNIEVNDTIFYNKFTGAEITIDEKKYIVLKVEDIYVTVK